MDRYYIGYCQDMEARLKEHLYNHKGFTGKAKDWSLKYKEEYAEKSSAYARERQVKKWKSRKMIEQLISSHND